MNSNYDVPDSTDWLNTPLKEFCELENALHCQICKEFYDTPMITSCNHTFCSKCIRTSLSSDGKCPACRTSDQASKLRNNWALQEVVSSFLAARATALDVARQAQEEPKKRGKRKRAVLDSDDFAEEAQKRTTRSKSRRIAASQDSQPEAIEIEDSEDEDYHEEKSEAPPPSGDGRLECPLGCGKRMKEEEVFGHLDKCEDEKKQAARAKSRTSLSGSSDIRGSQQKARPQERINELNYSMMKDGAFSKKLREIGIPSVGNKQQMISRHKEWVNIWNANCDSAKTRTKRELLHELDVWERTQGSRAPTTNGLGSAIMRKDFDGDSYAKKHQDEFSRLIADARRQKDSSTPRKDEEKATKDLQCSDFEEERSSFFSGMDRHDPDVRPKNLHDPRPYENNTEAMSSIREKVKAANEGRHVEPPINKEPSNQDSRPTSSRIAPDAAASDPVAPSLRRNSSKDEHLLHERTGSPCDIPAHLQSTETKKVPMFEVPGRNVTDIDGGT